MPNPWVDTPTRPYAAAAVGRGELAGEPPDRRRPATPVTRSARSGVKSATASRTALDAVDVRRPGAVESLVEQHVQHREQQRRVGAGPDEVVLVGDRGGLGAARVEHDHPAAARLQVAQPRGKSGTVIRLPLDAIGLAPKTRKYGVRSMSGIGISSWWPYSSDATSWCGSWSTVVAVNRLRVRSA